MPPKSAMQREHNVYLTTSVTFDNKNDDFGRLQVYQAFSSLDEANEFCEAKADELALIMDIEAPDPTIEHYTKDGTFRMELPLKHRNRDVTIETVIMPLLGGTIVHNKPVSHRTPRSTKASKSKPQQRKTKVKAAHTSDEEEEEIQSDDMQDGSPSPKTATNKTPNTIEAEDSDSIDDTPETLDAEHRDSVIDSSIVAEADIAAAPCGAPDCLQYAVYFVVGNHDYWSEEQIKVIVRRYGGTVQEKMPMYATDNAFSVILGSNAPSSALRRIQQKEFRVVTPQNIIARIRNTRGPESASHITSKEVADLCKQVSGKHLTRKRVIKCKNETDSGEDEYMSEES